MTSPKSVHEKMHKGGKDTQYNGIRDAWRWGGVEDVQEQVDKGNVRTLLRGIWALLKSRLSMPENCQRYWQPSNQTAQSCDT